MNKLRRYFLLCFCILLFAFSGSLTAVAAEDTEANEEPALVYVTGYELSGKTVTPGNDFTLTLTLKNSSATTAAENLIVSVTNPAGVVPEYGAVNVVSIEKLAAKATKKVTLKYSANADSMANELKFSVSVKSEGGVTNAEVRVPVTQKEKARVQVSSYKASAQPVRPGDSFSLTITLKNTSKDTAAENLTVTLNTPSGVVPQYGKVCTAQVSSIKAGETAELTFYLSTDKYITASNLNFTVGIADAAGTASTQLSVPVMESPEVGITGYEITKNPVVPGDDFTITLLVKNFSKTASAGNLTVNLSNPSGVIPEYGKVTTARIDKIAPNATVKVSFSFTATTDLTANELYFNASVTGNGISNSLQFSIPIRKIAQLYVVGYEVSNQTIVPGNDFALKLLIKNQSSEVTVNNAVVMISNPSGVVPEYGKVGVAFIESLKPEETTEVWFRYSSAADIKGSELNFTAGIFYDNLSTTTQIRVSIGRMTDFSVEESSMPEKLKKGKVGYASAMIENLEDTGVSNVVMVARSNGKEIATANIGAISAKTFKTQSVSLQFEEEGEYVVDLLLTYTNGAGENKEYLISTGTILVEAEEAPDNAPNSGLVPPEDKQEEPSASGISNLLLFSVSGFLMVGLCCVILILMYRRKR